MHLQCIVYMYLILFHAFIAFTLIFLFTFRCRSEHTDSEVCVQTTKQSRSAASLLSEQEIFFAFFYYYVHVCESLDQLHVWLKYNFMAKYIFAYTQRYRDTHLRTFTCISAIILSIVFHLILSLILLLRVLKIHKVFQFQII